MYDKRQAIREGRGVYYICSGIGGKEGGDLSGQRPMYTRVKIAVSMSHFQSTIWYAMSDGW